MSGGNYKRKRPVDVELTEMSLSEVAREIGLTPQAVQQIEVKALKKLKREAKRLGMSVFLEGI